jgi:hypothetical protein
MQDSELTLTKNQSGENLNLKGESGNAGRYTQWNTHLTFLSLRYSLILYSLSMIPSQ